YPLALDGKLAVLAATVAGTADAAPTDAENELFQDLSKRLDSDLTEWSKILTTDLVNFQKTTSRMNIQAVQVRAAPSR
ncbi:MAG: hypothetical protein KGN36_03670, partial [Acidobacteriota bacterium]|nr:hypothetical protein [Acidobacteriota bacterium]